MVRHLLGDIETRSRAELTKVGQRRYAADPSTQITTATWFWRGGNRIESACFVPGLEHLGTSHPREYWEAVGKADRCTFHNAGFDINVMRAVNPFFRPDLRKIDCTMARAQRLALPGGLDNLAKALGIEGKTDGGRALVMATCKPRRDGTFNEDPDIFRGLIDYNIQDTAVLAAVDEKLPLLPDEERIIWERTWRKNALGLPIDLRLAEAIAARREQIEREVRQELIDLTNGTVTAVTQRARILTWLQSQGVEVENTRKETLEELVHNAEDLPYKPYRVAHIMMESGGMAPSKAQAILDRHVNGRYLDGTRYHGARSGRGTSEGVNTFNIARPSGKNDIDATIARLKGGDQTLNNVALTDCLRGMIAAPDGYQIIDVDEANVELRICLWLANDQPRLDIIRNGGDLYIHQAKLLFGLPESADKKSHPKQRQDAKPVVLGCGYGMGGNRFYNNSKKDIPGLTLEMATAWVHQYRQTNKPIVALWRELNDAAVMALNNRGAQIAAAGGKLLFDYDGGTLWLQLPSGRRLPHYDPRIDEESGDMVFWRARSGRMLKQKAYGGGWTEIACQSIGRDLLTAVEKQVEQELPDVTLLLDVYDSLVGLAPVFTANQRVDDIVNIMRRGQPWSHGLPLDGEGYAADRMRK